MEPYLCSTDTTQEELSEELAPFEYEDWPCVCSMPSSLPRAGLWISPAGLSQISGADSALSLKSASVLYVITAQYERGIARGASGCTTRIPLRAALLDVDFAPWVCKLALRTVPYISVWPAPNVRPGLS
jgi:hypothetical protein